MLNPNLKHLRIFAAVGRSGSFRASARSLHISQPAASHAVSQIESLLSVKLMERTTRSVKLTDAGLAFLADAERLIEGLDRSITAAREVAASGRGRVSVACLSSAAVRLLPPVLEEMRLQLPKMNVELQDTNMRGILRSLESGDCDVAITSEDPAIKRNRFEPLLTDAFQVVCPAGHPLSRHAFVTGHDLAKNSCVMLRRDSGIRVAIDQALYARSIELQIVHETTQVHTALGLVGAGLGITVMPAMLCPAPEHSGLVVLPMRRPRVFRRIGMVFSALRTPSPGALAFADVFKRMLSTGSISMPRGVTRVHR